MDCNEIREKISCMLDEELSPEDSAAVAEHLAKCPECMSVFEAFHAVSESIGELEEVPQGFTEAVMKKLPKKAAAPKKNRRLGGYILSLAACLALVIFASGHLERIGLSDAGNAESGTAYNVRVETKRDENILVDLTGEEDPAIEPDSGEENIAEIAEFPQMMLLDPEDVPDEASEEEAAPAEGSAEAEPSPTPESLRESVGLAARPMSLRDLLVQQEWAAMDLYDMAPDATLSVEDAGGVAHELVLWFRDGRVYCQDLTTGNAYYPGLTPEQVQTLMNAKP